MKNYQIFFLSENFHFWVIKFSVHLNRHVFVMVLNKVSDRNVIQARPETLRKQVMMNRMINYINGSIFSKARYTNGVDFEILARTPVPKLPLSYPARRPSILTRFLICKICYVTFKNNTCRQCKRC